MRRLCQAVILLSLPIANAVADNNSGGISTYKLDINSPAGIATDRDGIAHVFAKSESDMAFLQGYVTARDRLFQIDVLRRTADGTRAELLGESELPTDVLFRTIGLRRAGERSLKVVSSEVRAALAAYATGINAYVKSNPLPPEYAALEIEQFRPWTEADSLAIGKLAGFPDRALEDMNRTLRLSAYQTAAAGAGLNGTALYFDDVERIAPFDPASPVPDSMNAAPKPRIKPHPLGNRDGAMDAHRLDNATLQAAREFIDSLHQAPQAEAILNSKDGERGSNAWVVSGRFSLTGDPLLASDPHLSQGAPSALYHMHLSASSAGIDVKGVTFPGFPYVVIGNNNHVSWAATAGLIDVIDVYSEQVVPDPTSPSGLSTVYGGELEHVVALPQSYRANVLKDGVKDNLVQKTGSTIPPVVLVVPRRNQGPIVKFNPATGVALSVQWTGFSGTPDLEAFRRFAKARNISDFDRALDYFDVGSQNFVVSDTSGNIAYFLSGEIPIREDLQRGQVAGAPPFLIRNGQGGNEWMSPVTKDTTRAIPFEILPRAEMPRVVNPPRGFIVTANNDPVGATLDNDPLNQLRPSGGISYIGSVDYDTGIRAGRIDDLIEERIQQNGGLTLGDMKDIQADTVMGDARFFTPAILRAFSNATKPGAHPALAQLAADSRIAQAVARFTTWDQSTPTGIREGFDANDRPGHLREPDAREIRNSVSTTIYSVWRNQFLRDTLVSSLQRIGLTQDQISAFRRHPLGTIRNLLETFDQHQGHGASGLNFFEVPGVDDAAARRDIVLLSSLAKALDLLAGEAYEAAFARSTNQNDYRWGRLHRLQLDHPLGGAFSIPSVGGAIPPPLGSDLPGFPFDGGLYAVDVSYNQFLVDKPSAYVNPLLPSLRYVSRVRSGDRLRRFGEGFDAETSLPGGQSGVPGNRHYIDLLAGYLTNKTIPIPQNERELFGATESVEVIFPTHK